MGRSSSGLDHSSLGTAQQKLFFFAILADGYLSFKVKILEYCDKEDTFTKEQYYIDLLKPKYNIPKVGVGGARSPSTKTRLAPGEARSFAHSPQLIARLAQPAGGGSFAPAGIHIQMTSSAAPRLRGSAAPRLRGSAAPRLRVVKR